MASSHCLFPHGAWKGAACAPPLDRWTVCWSSGGRVIGEGGAKIERPDFSDLHLPTSAIVVPESEKCRAIDCTCARSTWMREMTSRTYDSG